jgi:excisionase family DNA binding protein
MPIFSYQGVPLQSATHVSIDPFLTVKEAAAFFGVSVPTIWRWAANGIIPKPLKLGRLSRWPKSEILTVVEKAKDGRDCSVAMLAIGKAKGGLDGLEAEIA